MQASWSWSLYVWAPRPPTGCLPDGTRVSGVEVHRMPGGRYGAKGSKCSKTCHRVEHLKQITARRLIWRIEHKSQQKWECDRVITNSGTKLGLTAMDGMFDVLPVLLWPVLAVPGADLTRSRSSTCAEQLYMLPSCPSASLVITRQKHSEVLPATSNTRRYHWILSSRSIEIMAQKGDKVRKQGRKNRQILKTKKRSIGSLTFPDREAFHLRRCLILHCFGLQFDILFFFFFWLVQFQPQQQCNWPEICFCAWNFNSITSLLLYSTEIQS